MRTAFYAGTSGLLATQKAMDNLANNVANVSTHGFKPQNMSFQDLIYDEMYVNTPTDPEKGHGVKAEVNDVNFTQSSFVTTGYALDFAISGKALFGVEFDGAIGYTRAGNFNIGVTEDAAYLVTQDGGFVLDQNGERITLTKKPDTEMYSTEDLTAKIGLFDFDNPNYLIPVNGNLYAVSEKSGAPTDAARDENTLIQYALENSGTNLADEMSEMISVQRAFQLSSRVVQTADENQRTINELRR